MVKTDYNFIADLDLDSYASSKLRLILLNTDKGSNLVLLTPLGKAVNPDVILKEWDTIFNKSKSVLNSDVLKFESQNRAKYGPRSIALPWSERIKSVEDYFGEGPKVTLDQPPKVLLKGSLRPISFDKARGFLKNNTNSGLPYLKSKGQIKPGLTLSKCRVGAKIMPCVIFTRTQEGKRSRTVWGYPIDLTVLEMMYYRPLLDYQRKKIWRSALSGPDAVDKHMFELVTSSFRRNVPLLSIDFKSYDASLKPNAQVQAWEYIKALYQPEYHNEIEFIKERFQNIELVTPSGIMKGIHGVPSGSTFTNEVDSIAQYVISRYTNSVFDESMQIQGDDAVYSIKEDSVASFLKAFEDRGLNVHKDADLVSYNKCEYLRKLYHIDYLTDDKVGGIYSTYRALCRIVFQERWTDFEDFNILGKDYYSIRTICILENCKHHPLFAEFVKFVYGLDKYKLKFSTNGLNDYIRMIKETKGEVDVIANQYGDDIKGINNFETVKLLKQLTP